MADFHQGDVGRPVVVVAGATRGAGRGLAVAAGELGATVYCVGRSTRSRVPERGTSPFALEARPETIEDTAERVDAAGGQGIPVVADLTTDAGVRQLHDIVSEGAGHVDALVNSTWGGDELAQWGTPIAELDIEKGRTMFERALFSHVRCVRALRPLLTQPGGIIVELTDGDDLSYRGALFYDLVKLSVIRLAFALAEELREVGIASVAVTPGFLRSEAMLEHFGVTETDWQRAVEKDPHFAYSETPMYVGRGVAALIVDPERMSVSGCLQSSWQLAKRYGIRDVDDNQPDWGAHKGADPAFRSHDSSARRFVEGTAGSS